MRIILRNIAAPIVVILTVAGACLAFIFSFAEMVLKVVSGIGVLLGVVTLVTGQTTNGIIILVIAFLLSPVGLPAIAEWLLDKLFDFNYSLRDFITS